MAEWTRVTYFLPISSVNDKTAYLRVLNYLRSRHPGSGHPVPLTGFSSTVDDPEFIKGFYWSHDRGAWIDDAIALVFIDFNKSIDGADLDHEARTIKAQIEKLYEEEGTKQEEVWVTAQRIHLIT